MGYEYIGPDSEAQPATSPDPTITTHQSEGQHNSNSTQHNGPQSEAALYSEPSYQEHVSRPLPGYGGMPFPRPAFPPPQMAPGQTPAVSPWPAPGHPAFPQQQQQMQQMQQPPATSGIQQRPQMWAPAPGGAPGYYNGQAFYQPAGAGYPPYAQGYYGYPGYTYAYPWQPPRPRRDTYQFVVAIIAFICSCLTLLGGIISALLLLLVSVSPATSGIRADQMFSTQVLFLALTLAGLIGGGYCVYHSIRALFLKKPSAEFKLPWFWIFFVLYLAILILGAFLRGNTKTLDLYGTTFLIFLAGILPALTFLALGLRRLHYPRGSRWSTTWRRVTFSVVSGATLGVVLALIFELILSLIVGGLSFSSLSDPNISVPHDFTQIIMLFLVLSVIAPLVEEAVKPLAVIVLIGRLRNAAEAFVLGMACGIGFDLIETSAYISQGYKDWLDVAIQRSTAGLLHGFGAAMVALGWYYLTHRNSINRRILVGLGCIIYAVLQHALWNGSFLLLLLPDPIGSYLDHGMVVLGPVTFQSILLVYLFESLLMLIFFLFVTGKLRGKTGQPPFWQRLTRNRAQRDLTPAAVEGRAIART